MEKNWLNISLIAAVVAVIVAGAYLALDTDRTNVVINATDSPFIEDEFGYKQNGEYIVCKPSDGMKFEKITVEIVNLGNSTVLFDLDDIVLNGSDGKDYIYDDATMGYSVLTGNLIAPYGNMVEPPWNGPDFGAMTIVLFYEIPLSTSVSGYEYVGSLTESGGFIFNYS